jgi:hypothetical protein
MNSDAKAVFAAALCAIVSLATSVMAQDRAPPHPAKTAPTAQPTELTATVTVPNPYTVPARRLMKPPVVTAVAPKGPVPAGQHSIIFVGGKKKSGGDAALNPQPIPPGHSGPGDPIHW